MFSASIVEKTELDRLRPAFTVFGENWKELIAEYDGKLWKCSRYSADMLEKPIYSAADHSRQSSARFLLTDEIVWEQCDEPAYRVYLDGSVKISVNDSESDVRPCKRFNAFQYDEAILTARRIAHRNGEQKDISFRPIRVYLSHMVKYPLNSEYASLYDAAGLRIPPERGYSVEQIGYLAHFLKTDRFEVTRMKGKGSDALFLIGDGFREKQMDRKRGEHFRKQVIDILNGTALKPVPVECQLGDTVIWLGTWQVSEPK